jgi:hypothetical protein
MAGHNRPGLIAAHATDVMTGNFAFIRVPLGSITDR